MQRIEQIRKEARNIQMALECMNNPNIEAMIERLDQLGVYYARSGELLSEVVGMRDAAVARLFHDEKETIISLSPSLATKLVNSSASELNALEKWLDRINASCKHQCDNLRTMISYEKEQRAERFQNYIKAGNQNMTEEDAENYVKDIVSGEWCLFDSASTTEIIQ